MRVAFICYTLLLVIEGLVAWLVGGSGFLLAAGSAVLLLYSMFVTGSKAASEAIRLVGSFVLAVAGPLYYRQSLTGIVLSLLAMPTLLAATQALWESKWSADGRASESPRLRGLVFTIAVLATLGGVAWLSRQDSLPAGWNVIVPAAVLVLAFAAWDLSRIMRLKPASVPDKFRPGSLIPRMLLLGLSGLALAWLYHQPLTAAAEALCRISPKASTSRPPPESAPPRPSQPPPEPNPDEEITSMGGGVSAITGEHRLPNRANLQSQDVPELFIEIHDQIAGSKLAETGPFYVRTHTFNRYRDATWTSTPSGGDWVKDDADGLLDGWSTVQPAPPSEPLVRHTVYLPRADGYALPALLGARRYRLEKVFSYASEKCQAEFNGNVSYEAESRPLFWDQLPNHATLKPAAGDAAHLAGSGDELEARIRRTLPEFFGENTLLADRITALRKWYADHITYSPKIGNKDRQKPIENFLFFEEKGYCDFYASSAVLILRAANIPARLAHGWASREYDPASRILTITDTNAHAWTEILVDGVGWVACDFTPPQNIGQISPPKEKPAQDRSLDPGQFESKSEPKPAEKEQAPAVDVPKTWQEKLNEAIMQGDWLGLIMHLLPFIAGGAFLWWLARRLLNPKKRKEEALAKARALRDRQPAWLAEFCELCAASGQPREDGSTVKEFFRRLRRTGFLRNEFDDAVAYHYLTRYEDAPVDETLEEQFLVRVRTFRGADALRRQE